MAEPILRPMPAAAPVVSVRGLVKHFNVGGGLLQPAKMVRAVDGVSLDVDAGETLALVGESGCGKTTLGRVVLRLIEPTGGAIWFRGRNVTRAGTREMSELRRKMQLIFQDPYSSLNPRLTIGGMLKEAMGVAGVRGSAADVRARELMESVGMSAQHMGRYPLHFSGGQRQRLVIARALAVSPEFLVCDEPVSALDVSIQSQILNLLHDLQQELQLSYLFISHDLSVVRYMADRVAVMYLGQIVELAKQQDLFASPLHPYTQALLSAVPVPNPRRHRQRIVVRGEVPSPMRPPAGCRFHTRCPAVTDRCRVEAPALKGRGETGHQVACHLYD